MPFLTRDGLRFHYQQAGTGPDVVLIHGVTGDLSIWMLCGLYQQLKTRYRVTIYDLRGHGYSDAPPTSYTSDDHSDDLLGIMSSLGIEEAFLVGHSFGGVIAAHTAVKSPDQAWGLILSDPYFPSLRHLEDVSRWGHWEAFRQEASDAGVDLSGEHWYDLGRFFDQVLHLDDERMLKLRQAVGLPALNRLLRLGSTTCGDDTKVEAGLTVEKLHSIQVPVLALYGEQSPFLATAEYLAEHLPQCRNAIVRSAKHRAPEENPSAFVEAVAGFVDEAAQITKIQPRATA